MSTAAYFLGYDPGGVPRDGVNKHGIARARIRPDGTFDGAPETDTLEDVQAVCQWLVNGAKEEDITALGIDTLLAWSVTGRRACDRRLKEQYHPRLVIHQNALYSAMTVNGAMAAMKAQTLGIALCESHPKLLLRILGRHDTANREMLEHFSNLYEPQDDHAADALVAAWCAAQWHFRRWTVDLYDEARETLCFYAGHAAYPWPEALSVREGGAQQSRRRLSA